VSFSRNKLLLSLPAARKRSCVWPRSNTLTP
jgi:hypothetical protein